MRTLLGLETETPGLQPNYLNMGWQAREGVAHPHGYGELNCGSCFSSHPTQLAKPESETREFTQIKHDACPAPVTSSFTCYRVLNLCMINTFVIISCSFSHQSPTSFWRSKISFSLLFPGWLGSQCHHNLIEIWHSASPVKWTLFTRVGTAADTTICDIRAITCINEPW